MNVPEVSIIVTNYNYGSYVQRCLRSVLNQNHVSHEVIVVDDCSTDNSIEMIKVFEPDVRIFSTQKNSGVAAAANLGIKNSRGQFVIRVDADDYVHRDFIRVLLLGYEFFGTETEAISTDYQVVTPEGILQEYGHAEKEPIACAIAFKVDALETLGFYNHTLRINEEVDLRKRFYDKGFRIRNINLPLYRYVKHSSSLSRSVII